MILGNNLLIQNVINTIIQTLELGTVTYVDMNTSPTNSLTADGFSWANAMPLVIDQYNNYIVLCEWVNSGTSYNTFVVSTDLETWTMPTHLSMSSSNGDMYLIRGTPVYDSINDKIHVLWNAESNSDGIIYRRYIINRDGSNLITSIQRDTSVNLVIDNNAGSYEHPQIHFLNNGTNGEIIAIWAVRNGSNEIRGSRRVLSNTSDDNNTANWLHLGVNSTTTIGQSPNVQYTALVTKTGIANISYCSIGFNSDNDLFIAYTDGDSTEEIQICRWNYNGTNWSNVLSNLKVADLNTSLGYSLKNQLITTLHEDITNLRIYFGFSRYNNGDTWSFVYLDETTDTLSAIVDVYQSNNLSANAFITGDLIYDNVNNIVITTYSDLPLKHIYACIYDGLTLIDGPKLLSSARPFDIPTLYKELINNQLVCVVRDFNDESINETYTPPYDGKVLLTNIDLVNNETPIVFSTRTTNDGYWRTFLNNDQTYIDIGNVSGNITNAFLLFESVNIPKDAIIDSATLTITARTAYSNSVSYKITGANDINPDAPTDVTSANAITKLTNEVNWIPGVWVDGIEYSAPDISAIIQEIINNSSWKNGYNILLFIEDNGSASNEYRRIDSKEEAYLAPNEAILEIEFKNG